MSDTQTLYAAFTAKIDAVLSGKISPQALAQEAPRVHEEDY